MGACEFVSVRAVRVQTVSIAGKLFGKGVSPGTHVVSEAGSTRVTDGVGRRDV